MSKPVLSIGIIFKNEIRCLERCLKALQPLREAIPCELIMADTGAVDGSRQVAEKYADLVFDFEWINDFAAARNAVMDRCSGKWYMSIDCDEWLAEEFTPLVNFLKTNESHDFAAITIRNYKSSDLDKGSYYADFTACRLLRMSTGLRYVGAIHEHLPSKADGTQNILLLPKVIFHHDGYVYADPVATKEKMERNMTALREELEENPNDLRLLMQCIESGEGFPEYLDYIRRAVKCVKEQQENYKMFGASIMRHAVLAAYHRKLPELNEYIEFAEEMFPNSMFTRLDVQYAAFGVCWEKKDYVACIQRGEKYMDAIADFETDNYDHFDTLCSTVAISSPGWKQQMAIFLAASYLQENQMENAYRVLKTLDGSQMNIKQVGDCVRTYAHLYSRSKLPVETSIDDFWNQISQPIPDETRSEQRRNEFIRISSEVFLPAYREDEVTKEHFCRPAYSLFLPLEGKCVLGDAAAVLQTEDISILEDKLSRIDDLERLPIHALYHALDCGIQFPLKKKPLKMEEMDVLACRLSQDKDNMRLLIERITKDVSKDDMQSLTWTRGVVIANLYVTDWKGESEAEWGMAAIRAFTQVEKVFLPRCYVPETLTNQNIFILPPMHRFGFYCSQAFDALDAGDPAGYVRLLREGLSVCEGMKPMVEFLLEHTPELQTMPELPAELQTLADQIRTVLAKYEPDDPAVAALKQSKAYQKVAYLIEGVEVPVVGGLPS